MSGLVPGSCDGLPPLWVAESIILPVVLCSHYHVALDPVCVLCSHHVGPVVKRDWPRDHLINDGLGEGWIQSSPEQEDHTSGVPFPLHDISEVVKHCDVGIKIFPLHFDS